MNGILEDFGLSIIYGLFGLLICLFYEGDHRAVWIYDLCRNWVRMDDGFIASDNLRPISYVCIGSLIGKGGRHAAGS